MHLRYSPPMVSGCRVLELEEKNDFWFVWYLCEPDLEGMILGF
jgi:hypothetical protein